MSYAQGAYLNKNRSEIRAEFSKRNIPKQPSQKNGDDVGIDSYSIGDHHLIMFGYDFDSICTVVSEIYQNNVELDKVINDFNKKFQHIEDGHWITKDKQIDIVLVKREGWFAISYHEVDEFK